MDKPNRRWEEIGKVYKRAEKWYGYASFGMLGHVQMMGTLQEYDDIQLESRLVKLPIQRVLALGFDLESNLGWVDDDRAPTPPRDRWVQVGRLMRRDEDKYSGFLTLGILGQIPIIARQDRNEPCLNLLSLAHRLFFNQIDLLGKDYEDHRQE